MRSRHGNPKAVSHQLCQHFARGTTGIRSARPQDALDCLGNAAEHQHVRPFDVFCSMPNMNVHTKRAQLSITHFPDLSPLRCSPNQPAPRRYHHAGTANADHENAVHSTHATRHHGVPAFVPPSRAATTHAVASAAAASLAEFDIPARAMGDVIHCNSNHTASGVASA